MKVLGIDTILHDACAAVVEDGSQVLSNIAKHSVMSSDKLLDLSVLHLQQLGFLVKKALQKADCKINDISLIAVNNFGSLLSNVMVGVSAANIFAQLYDIPIIAVHHQEAHFFSNWLERDFESFGYPVVVFSASGGHSSIVLIKNNKFNFKIISDIEGMKEISAKKPTFRGVGAVYSFVAYSLELGKEIDSGRFISEAAKGGNSKRFVFPSLKRYKANNLDFSDLEKEIENIIEKERQQKDNVLSQKFISDIAASFEDSISNTIIEKLIRIAKRYKAKEIHLVGGISANDYFRKKVVRMARENNLIGRYPKKKSYCTDNAAMIASLGYYRHRRNPKKYSKQRSVDLISNLKLEKMAINQYLDSKKELC